MSRSRCSKISSAQNYLGYDSHILFQSYTEQQLTASLQQTSPWVLLHLCVQRLSVSETKVCNSAKWLYFTLEPALAKGGLMHTCEAFCSKQVITELWVHNFHFIEQSTLFWRYNCSLP